MQQAQHNFNAGAPTPLDLMFEGRLMNSSGDTTKHAAALGAPLCGIVGEAPSRAVGMIQRASLRNEMTLPGQEQARRVPCKARGVSGKHNPQTAYFDIPVNARHGMLLVCSHPECAESGRRFRYCAVCELPVAKRNFIKRHAHGLVASTRNTGFADMNNNGDIPLMEDSAAPVSKRRRTLSFDAAECLHSGLRHASGQPGSTGISAAGQQLTTSNVAEHIVLSGVPSTTRGQPAAATATGDNMMPMQLNPREFQWLALLHNKPSLEDTRAMASWMDRIMQVSDNTASLPSAKAPSVSSNPNAAASSETASSSSSSSNDPASSSSGGSDRNSSSGESDGGDPAAQQQTTADAEQDQDQEAPHVRLSTGKQLHDDDADPDQDGAEPSRYERQRRRSSAWSAMSLENLSLGRMDSLFDDNDDDED